jgi:hypothetical protein
MRDRILINKELIPYTFNILLGDETFSVGVDYNATADFFTLSLSDANGNVITRSEKLVYNMPLFADIYNPVVFPCLTIIPVDESGEEIDITWDNFGETVFLSIDDEGDSNE